MVSWLLKSSRLFSTRPQFRAFAIRFFLLSSKVRPCVSTNTTPSATTTSSSTRATIPRGNPRRPSIRSASSATATSASAPTEFYGAPLPSLQSEFGLRIFNPDGSEAEKSGNGLRIFSRYLWDQGLVKTPQFTVETPGGHVQSVIKENAG